MPAPTTGPFESVVGDLKVSTINVRRGRLRNDSATGDHEDVGDVIVLDVEGLVEVPDEADVETTLRLIVHPHDAHDAGLDLLTAAYRCATSTGGDDDLEDLG